MTWKKRITKEALAAVATAMPESFFGRSTNELDWKVRAVSLSETTFSLGNWEPDGASPTSLSFTSAASTFLLGGTLLQSFTSGSWAPTVALTTSDKLGGDLAAVELPFPVTDVCSWDWEKVAEHNEPSFLPALPAIG